MSSRYRSSFANHAALAALTVLASRASAQSNERYTYTINTEYKASGIDATGLGQGADGKPVVYNGPSILLGPHIAIPGETGSGVYGGKASIDIPAINWGLFTTPAAHLGYLGAEANLVLNGDCGIRMTPRYSGGQLDYTYNALLTLDMPRYPSPGQLVTIKYSTGAGFATFHTTQPTFGAKFETVAAFEGSIGGSAYFFSDTPFASGTHAFNAKAESKSFDIDLTGAASSNIASSILDLVNKGIGNVNPLPISVSGYVPVLTAGPASVDSSGTVNARGFAKFMSLDTSLMDLMLAVIPEGGAKKALEITQGDYSIPGTNYDVNWAICKTAANMDVGFDGRYSLAPINKSVSLLIKDASGNVVGTTQGPNSVTFTMPAGGISITPTLTQDFQFSNTVGINIQGAIGFYPFSGGAKGNLSDLAKGTNVDFQFDVARLEKKFDPTVETSSQIFKKVIPLTTQPDRSRTLTTVGLNAYSPTDLPNELYFPDTYTSASQSPRIANLHAYGEGTDKDYVVLSIFPEQGRQFFLKDGSVAGDGSATNGSGSIPVKASMLFPDGVRLLVTRTFNGQPGGLVIDSANGSKIGLRIPLSYVNFALARGVYSMSLTVDTTNSVGSRVAKTYNFPLQVYARNPVISGQFNTTSNLSTQGATFKVTPLTIDPADGTGKTPATLATTQNLYFNSQFVLKDTVMTIDNPNDPANPYTLPVYGVGNNGTLAPLQDSGVNGNQVCAISLSNALVQELGGRTHNMQLRTPGTGSKNDGTPYGPALSPLSSLFFIAKPPADVVAQPDPGSGFGDTPFWIGLTGSNFAQITKVYLTDVAGNQFEAPTVAYGSPTSMRVQVPADFIASFHKAGKTSFSLQLKTPPLTEPSNDTGGIYPSGGESNVVGNLSLAYPAPSVASLDQAKVSRGLASLKLRVTGSNFFLYNAQSGATTFTVGGKAVSPSAVSYPATNGITVPYVDLTITDASILGTNGTYLVQAKNGTTTSLGATLTVENGAPKLGSLSQTRFRVGPSYGYAPTLTGAPFYKETTFLLNGSKVGVRGFTSSSAALDFGYDFLKTINASTVTLTASNPTPGGGASGTIQVSLEEGDASTVKVVPGALVYDRPTNTYKQSFAVTYIGARDVSRGARILFQGLGSDATLVNADGTMATAPYLNTSLVPRRQVTIVAIFKKNGSAAINSAPSVGFSD